ncbi:MAG: ribonuclease H [Myxococcota bacterium]
MPDFICGTCQRGFSIPEATLAKFPGWVPKQCLKCRKSKGGNARSAPAKRPSFGAPEANRTTAEVLAMFSEGPDTGVFTDGAASPNPGPGGWGAVCVIGGEIIGEKHGHEPHTTNNRMELKALIAGYRLVPRGTSTVVYTDSELCVKTITQWAATWEKNGWRKKGGEIKNLELVQELFDLAQGRPEISLQWIKAHAGSRWNEYADALATAYRRGEK